MEKVALEKRIALRNGQLKEFNTKWKPVLFLRQTVSGFVC